MKMKEVTARTGLTDKAVRLYIENELITPQTGESYTGRRSFDFSEENVQQLKNIATLRKAGFSLADIKALQQSDTLRETLRTFIDTTRADIGQKTIILQQLEPLLNVENLSVETICKSLETEVRTVPVPIPDLRYRTPISKEALFFRIYTILALHIIFGTLCALCVIVFIKELPILFSAYIYKTILVEQLIITGISLLFAAVILLLYSRKKKHSANNRQSVANKILRITAVVISSLVLLINSGISIDQCTSGLLMFPFFWDSKTENPKHYLSIDGIPEADQFLNDIYYLFPSQIPADGRYDHILFSFLPIYPETTTYSYHYCVAMGETTLSIQAEWHLSPENLDSELERLNTEPDRIAGHRTQGDWNCIYLKPTSLPHYECLGNCSASGNHVFLVFAYNSKTEIVRYVFDYAQFNCSAYHLSLDWS